MNISVTVDRIEGKMAVLELPDGTAIDWPIQWLPPINEGSQLEIQIHTPAEGGEQHTAEG